MGTITVEDQYTSGVYAKRQLEITGGQGALLFDAEGREYIDCVGGQGVASLGHAHPAVAQAVAAQAQQLINLPEMFYHPLRAALLERLLEVAPSGMQRAFLCNSGTESVEAAIKFARLCTGRKGIVAAMRGFHGRTMGSLSATWKKVLREPFEPLVPGFSHVAYNKLEALEAAVTDQTAAVILEVVQGEGGVYPSTAEFLLGAQALCRERGALLVIDEVQTGFGRTGKLFALEHHSLQPDLLCLAKAMAGGLPAGAVLLGVRVGELPTGAHGSTFGGSPLVCAAALATLDTLQKESLPERAAENGAYLLGRLREIESPLVREVRGLGLMIGIELKLKVAPFLSSLQERGVLALSAGMTTIRLLPPLVISRPQIDQVVDALQEVLADA